MALILKYKKYLIGVALAIVLVLGFNFWVGQKEDQAYQQGFQAANVQWEKKGKEYVDLIEKGYAENVALNQKLAEANEAKRKLEEERASLVHDQQIDYANSEEGKVKGLDKKFIKLYNDSLGE